MLRLYSTLALVAMLALAGFWIQHQSLTALRKDLGEANTLIDQQKAVVALLSARTDSIQRLTAAASKAAQENRNALEQALVALPDGGKRRTPVAVVDGLCKSLRCATSAASVVPVQPAPR